MRLASLLSWRPPANPNDLGSLAVSVARLGRGLVALHHPQPPARPLELYDFERCPHGRKVREALTELDLDHVWRTSAHGAATRAAAIALGGRARFPLLYDANTGKHLYEAERIIDYLWSTYAGPRPRWQRLVAPLDTVGSALASRLRARGRRVRPGLEARVQPAQLLELWSFEASPYCRKVREVLCELDLHALVHNVGKRGSGRPELVSRGGKMQVPYLEDPNTGVALYESDDIIAYLEATYGHAPET